MCYKLGVVEVYFLTQRQNDNKDSRRYKYGETCTGYVRRVTHDEIADRIG
jgi:hypothetical protein